MVIASASSGSSSSFPFESTLLKSQRKKSFAAVVFSSTTNLAPSEKTSCHWLRRLKHQSKICWKRRGLAEALLHAKNLSVTQCQTLFEFDQWNCSRREFFFKNIYRETAFMYSLASSAVMFSVARACSDGALKGCSCAEPGKNQNASKWQWGSCGDNIKFAKKFTKKFLQQRKKGDGFNSIIKYNTEIGMRVVVETLEKEDPICKCHGVSGTCTVKICWKRIKSFNTVAQQLKILYHSAIQVQPDNTVRSFKGGRNARQLLYLESSPNFCPTTVGRVCNNTENCATLCCGRDFYSTQVSHLNGTCNCRWRAEKFNVDCDPCIEKKTILRCT